MTSAKRFLFLTLFSFFTFSVFADAYPTEGAVVIYNGARACSAALFRQPSMSDNSPVQLLTAGHCAFGRSVNAALLTNSFVESAVIQNVRLVHAQVDGLDISIYALPLTYAELRMQYGIRPLPLASRAVDIGSNVTVVSAVWVEQQSCRIERAISLREGDLNWTGALRMDSSCAARVGFSGGQLVSSQNEIVGIIHTMNESGGRCTMGNPCEISNSQTQVLPNRAYGIQTSGITRCFNENGAFDLYLAQCPLTH